jgi:hypothetical protein
MKAEADLEVLQAEGLLSKKVRDKSATLQKRLTTLRETLVKLNEEYKEKAAKATAEDAALKRRKLIEEEKAENARVISDAATLILVEIVLGYQARFENTSDTSEKIFAHAHADYHKRIESGELGTSDAIATAESFTRRYKKELGCFNQLTAINSTSGWVVLFGNAAVSWGSHKQKSVALSTCEAEIIALSEATKDVVYMRKLLSGLGAGSKDPTDLSTDSKSARDVAYNPEHHNRMKHVLRRHFFVRDMVEEFEINVPFVPTDENPADFFTKPIKSVPKFFEMRARIMNERDRPVGARGTSGRGGASKGSDSSDHTDSTVGHVTGCVRYQ